MKIVLDKGAFVPERAHPMDAGLDFKAPDDVKVPAHGSVAINTGVHIDIPHGCYGKIESKSGLNVNHGIVSMGGTIDEGYTGSIVVKLYNMTDTPYQFRMGDKIAQLVISPCIVPDMVVVDELPVTPRGNNGFGSTGR